MLNYEGFVQELKEKVAGKLGEGYRVCMEKRKKVNFGLVDALAIADMGSAHSPVPVFYPGLLFRQYREGAGLEAIAEETVRTYHRHRKEGRDATVSAGDISDYGKIKGKLYFRLVHTETNRELLTGVPHFEVLDLSMVFYVLLLENEGGTGAVMADSRLLENWGITPEELREQAERNSPGLLPAKVESMAGMVKGIFGSLPEAGEGTGVEGNFAWKGETDFPLVLTNARMLDGFAAVLYPGVLKGMADRMGTDFYVLPSSRHEALLLPADFPAGAGELREMVREVNRTAVAQEDILSDSVYYYDRLGNELRMEGEEGKCAGL